MLVLKDLFGGSLKITQKKRREKHNLTRLSGRDFGSESGPRQLKSSKVGPNQVRRGLEGFQAGGGGGARSGSDWPVAPQKVLTLGRSESGPRQVTSGPKAGPQRFGGVLGWGEGGTRSGPVGPVAPQKVFSLGRSAKEFLQGAHVLKDGNRLLVLIAEELL